MIDYAERRRQGIHIAERGNSDGLPQIRCAVLATFTVDPLPALITSWLHDYGVYADTYLAGFQQLAQEVMDGDSGLYRFAPDRVLIVADLQDLFPDAYAAPNLGDVDFESLSESRLEWMRSLLKNLTDRLPGAKIYLATPTLDRVPVPYVLDSGSAERGQREMEKFVARFRALAEGDSVVSLDWDHRATGQIRDDRLWYLARMRLDPAALDVLAASAALHIAAGVTPPRKVLAIDLDGTLWGGVLGEDGAEGLVIGVDGLGLAFQDFQRELLRLGELGFLLAICSKNDEEQAWSVFESHPESVLRREDFAAARLNWQDKADNLSQIADELGLSLDSFVFLDDSPVERGWVSTALPQVLVPEMPDDPALRPTFLRNLPCLRVAGLTNEDRTRARKYRERSDRNKAQAVATSLGEYLASLRQEAMIAPVAGVGLERAAQLCQRTNQFNLTSRRHSTIDLGAMANDPMFEVYSLSLRDCFGDNGITGLGILRFVDSEAWIDTLLLSCRVIGRRAEDALLAFLAERASQRGASHIVGIYEESERNGQVADLYPRFGFTPAEEKGVWRLDLSSKVIAYPEGITVRTEALASAATSRLG